MSIAMKQQTGLPLFDRSELRAGEVRVLASTAAPGSKTFPKGFAAAVIDEGANEYDVPAGSDHAMVFTFARRERIVTDLLGRRTGLKMAAKSFSVVPAGQQSYWNNETPGGRMLHLHISPQTFGEWFEQATELCEVRPVFADNDAELRQCCERMTRELLDPAKASPMMIEALALQIAVLARRKYGNDVPIVPVKGGLAPWQLRQTIEFLNDHLGDDISIEVLAANTGLSKYHFMRAFRQSTGATVIQTLIESRIQKARELLEHTNLSVREIANAIGYRAPQAFAKVFLRETGLPPADYRRERHHRQSAALVP